ncbi:MAG TPA: PQQ-binding-like beta-propeller repeat protein [Vicinamibacterales bacterium]|nr:PQQ-binding-like beta-propeller repeat protein [Vicinamibacterales bacterium]
MIQTHAPSSRKPLRLWPGVAAAVLLLVLRFIVPVLSPDAAVIGLFGSLACAAAIVIWWLFFSRAPWLDRLLPLAVVVVAFFAIRPLLDKSIVGGMMGMMFALYALPPIVAPAFVASAVASRGLSIGLQRATMVVTIFLAAATWTAIRTDGITGGAGVQLHWRWTKTYEERLLAQGDDDAKGSAARAAASKDSLPTPTESPIPAAPAPTAPTATAAVKAAGPAPPEVTREAEWPGFRGRDRDGVIHGVRLETDWTKSAPVEMWRRPVGPGWSSFAVSGDLLYTQEQRGGDEVVSCYRVSTGKSVWRHRDATRFWESNGGAGPRGTPALSNGHVYTFGATGLLNALDAVSGAVLWSRNVSSDAHVKVPMWGFASSPLVIDDTVIVAAAGKLAGYDAATGQPRWLGPAHPGSYSSPQRSTFDGVTQVVLLSAAGATSVSPATGKALWEYQWPDGGVTIVQPATIGDSDLLISSTAATGGLGIRRLGIAHGPRGWSVEERWESSGLKPYFNDYVVNKGYAFGFDGNILSCIDLSDGTRKWKGGRYGNGQLVLLPEQDLLLVVSEEGDLALVKATPDQFTEVAHVPALEGKTWNHPVIVRDVLLMRNDHEMAAYKLSLEPR